MSLLLSHIGVPSWNKTDKKMARLGVISLTKSVERDRNIHVCT